MTSEPIRAKCTACDRIIICHSADDFIRARTEKHCIAIPETTKFKHLLQELKSTS